MTSSCWWAPTSGGPCTLAYPVHKAPPWALSFLFALQHLIVQSSLLYVCHFLLLQSLPVDRTTRSQLLATSLFGSGISTGLQTILGSRLPLVQTASFEFLIPSMILSRHISMAPATGGNDTAGPVVCSEQHCMTQDAWNEPIREISGAVLIAGMLQVLLAISGLCGRMIQMSGPMVLASTLSIIGLSSYKEAALVSSTHWGVALLLVLLVALLSQNLRCCYLPLWTWTRSKGCLLQTFFPAFHMLSVLLSVCCLWIGFHILSRFDADEILHSVFTSNASFPADAATPAGLNVTHAGRFDAETSLQSASWLKLPYPGESGWPLLSTRALSVGIGMAVSSSMNSLGCYVLCARVLHLPSVPHQAFNRGVCMEAIGNILCGVLGSVSGAVSSIPNACTSGLTQVGSRHSVLLGALMAVALGLSPKAVEFLSTIPMAVHGGVLCVTYGLAVGAGISFFQYADIGSGRNIFLVGFTMFMALLVPRWLSAAPDNMSTGWVFLDLLLLSLMTSPVTLSGVFSFFLDNTISGTVEERGLLPDLSLWHPDSGEDSVQGRKRASHLVYGLPRAFSGWSYLSRQKETFPCRTFCLPDSEVDATEAEKATSLEEGTSLLEKPTSLEMGPIIHLHPSDTERDRQTEC
ncbi:solute carrier family 23 member 3 isoform X2 [Ambystoma mexicanum]|uniref:solute carrier family 23 member 3 isoform X1 n=1 Tax=Ambystoma mexicanum TaxID=8296 RepID=UPI0037E82431